MAETPDMTEDTSKWNNWYINEGKRTYDDGDQ